MSFMRMNYCCRFNILKDDSRGQIFERKPFTIQVQMGFFAQFNLRL